MIELRERRHEEIAALESLHLSGTRITDEGLKQLEALTALEELDVSETEVTEEGVRRLQAAMPGLVVRR